jgi:hypothetical protein
MKFSSWTKPRALCRRLDTKTLEHQPSLLMWSPGVAISRARSMFFLAHGFLLLALTHATNMTAIQKAVKQISPTASLPAPLTSPRECCHG